MPYYWTVNKGPCACCGACGLGYLMMDAITTRLGTNPIVPQFSTYQYSGTLSTMNGLSIPNKFTRWEFLGFARRVQTDSSKSLFSFSYASYQSGMHCDDQSHTSGTFANLGEVNGLNDTVYTYMDATNNPTIAEITWIIALYCDDKTCTEAINYFTSRYDEFMSNYTSGGFIEG